MARIVNCTALKTLAFDSESCRMFRAVELQELPSLETLTFVDSFQIAEELKVENMDNLVSLRVYGDSFQSSSALIVRNCP